MKVAVVLEKLDLTRGGAERSTWEMANALRAAGAEVTLVAGAVVTEGLGRQDLPVVSLGVKALTRAGWWHRFAAAVARHVAGGGYDIVHSIVPLACADVYQPRGGSMTHIIQRHVETADSDGSIRFKRATAWLNFGRQARLNAERALCRRPAGPVVTALSGYVAGQFRRDYGLSDERIALVRNGVAVAPFISEQTRTQARNLRRLFDPDDLLAVLVYVGANFKRKGLDWLIRAAALARAQNNGARDFRILVVSPDDFTPYWQMAKASGLQNQVLFLGQSRQVPALYAMADGVVLPTRDDACSRVVMEGLAAGTPAITTRFNGAADFLEEGRYGVIVERCDDDQELAGAILTLCDRGQCQAFKGRIAAGRLDETVSMARHARELMALYEKLLATQRAPGR